MRAQLNRRQVIATLAVAPLAVRAQSADHTTVVVPYPPGSAPDFLARTVATATGEILRKTIVVENRPGANAILGSDYVAKARADGSYLLLVDRMTVVVNPLLYAKLPYDPKLLQPISDVARINLLLTVRSDAPYKTWGEFVTYAKSNPGQVSIGTGGNGSVHHLSLELLSRAIGATFVHVPYKGSLPAVQDLLGGQLDGVIAGPDTIRPHIAGGKIRVLAVGGDARSNLFPDVPVLRELGITTPVLLPTTFAMFAPPSTPEAALAPFRNALRSVLERPQIAAQMADLGLSPVSSTPKEMQAALDAQNAQLKVLIRDAHIRLD